MLAAIMSFAWFSFVFLAVLPCAALFGGMLFFAFMMAPLIFLKLPAETAGGFIRQVFPVYYLTAAGLAALTAALAALGRPVEGAVMALVALGFLLARQILMPRINAARDAQLGGDGTAAARFTRLHRASVILNAVQIVAVTFVMARLVAAA
jgi:Domain of unknown function (DUF4149)